MISKKVGVVLGISLITALAGAAGVAQDNPEAADKPMAPAPQFPEAPSVEERYAAIAKSGEPGEAIVVFDRLLADGQIMELLKRAGTRPYAVHMFQEGMSGLHQVPLASASLDIIAEARSKTADMQAASIRGSRRRAAEIIHMQEQGRADAPGEERSRAVLSAIRQSEALASEARRGAPMIYAVRVVGTADQLRDLAASASVSKLVPGYEVRGRVVVPSPTPPPDARGTFSAPAVDQLRGETLRNELRSAATGAGSPS